MNITDATIDYLAQDMGVSRLVEGRVYGAELPEYEFESMPRMTIVVRASGGLGTGAGTASRTPWTRNRFDIRCYGETPYRADIVHGAVYRAMNNLQGHAYGDLFLSTAVVTGGPVTGRDTNADWPFTIGVYTVSAVYDTMPE